MKLFRLFLLSVACWQGVGGSTARGADDPSGSQPTPTNPPGLYQETLRPQYHFSARKGWLNDPNGLIFADRKYHLFYQATPGSRRSEEKWWGHAVSKDLVHWTEIDAALVPEANDSMWSGSAVIDWRNRSGFSPDGSAPLVLVYTRAIRGDERHGQTSLAISHDGIRFTKFDQNPVLDGPKETNRDPRVFWYDPDQCWIMALYVEQNGHHNVRFYHSPNLRQWTEAGQFPGDVVGQGGFLYECPDLWEMAVEGEPNEKRWIITGGNTEYMVGKFDGKTFTPETPKLPGHRGRGYYAPQTFNEEKLGRRVRLGWLQTDAPGMPFSQSMSLPSEHKLVRTPEGLRLTWTPIEELARLHGETYALGPCALRQGDPNPLDKVRTDLLEIQAVFTPAKAGKTIFSIRGIPVAYDAAKGELLVGDRRVATPLTAGKLDLMIYVDRLSLEVFASGGLTYVPLPVDFSPENRTTSLQVEGEAVRFEQLGVFELKSAWKPVIKSD